MKRIIESRLLRIPCAVAALWLTFEATSAESYRALVLSHNPVAYYRLEEAAGEGVAADSSATAAFPGTYIPSADGFFPRMEQAGLEVNSVYFRDSSYVQIPYAPELNTAGPFTGEAWVRTISVATDGSYRSPVCNFGGWTGDAPGWFRPLRAAAGLRRGRDPAV